MPDILTDEQVKSIERGLEWSLAKSSVLAHRNITRLIATLRHYKVVAQTYNDANVKFYEDNARLREFIKQQDRYWEAVEFYTRDSHMSVTNHYNVQQMAKERREAHKQALATEGDTHARMD